MLKKKTGLLFLLLFLALCAFNTQDKKSYNIVFIGDSITEGGGLKDRTIQAAPACATAYLLRSGRYNNIQFSNKGFSGFTTVDFLPSSKKAYPKVIAAADIFKNDRSAALVFSVMLGTNDSAVKGPNGSPVSPANYHSNLKTIADSLLARYPDCKIILHAPLWYSDSTRNTSTYLIEGRERLQSYIPHIKALVKEYKSTHPGHVFLGDTKGYDHFRKNYLTEMRTEKGPSGIFYLHPNQAGASALGDLWAKSIAKVLK